MTFELQTGRDVMAGVQDRGAVFDEVTIGRPATGALVDAGYSSLGDLPDDLDLLLKLHGVGPSAVARLKAARSRGSGLQGTRTTPNAVDAYIARQIGRDPDLWVLEIDGPDLTPPFEARIV